MPDASSENTRPIVWVLKGQSWFLPLAIRQAQLFNPACPQLVVSTHRVEIGGVQWFDINNYMEDANRFADVYVHCSSTGLVFERHGIQRWMILADFLRSQNLEQCFCVDNDVLLFCDILEDATRFRDFDATHLPDDGPINGYLNETTFLDRFRDFLFDLYTKDAKRVESWFADYKLQEREGGMTEMMLFAWFREQDGGKYGNLCAPNSQGEQHDEQIHIIENWENDGKMKRIFRKKGLPFGRRLNPPTLARLLSLHFQGYGKPLMLRYSSLSLWAKLLVWPSFARAHGALKFKISPLGQWIVSLRNKPQK